MIDQNTDTAKTTVLKAGGVELRIDTQVANPREATERLMSYLRANEGVSVEELQHDDRLPDVEVDAASSRKRELLDHYATREPKDFVQVDVFASLPAERQDEVMRGDEDGDVMFIRATTELMHGASIRVLADPTTTKDDAIRALTKIIDLYEHRGLLMTHEELRRTEEPPQA